MNSKDFGIQTNSVSDAVHSFIFFTNFILRNVIPAKRIGHVHDGNSLGWWFDQNGFERVFEFSEEQARKLEIPFLSKIRADAVVALNPFGQMDLAEIEKTLEILNLYDLCLIAGIATSTNHETKPKLPYSGKKWKEILNQLGDVVEVFRGEAYHLFLVTPHGNI